MIVNSAVKKLLLDLEFNESESQVFLTLVELGKATGSVLSKRSGVQRTTAYSALSNLVQKGLVSQQEEKSGTIYQINRPAALMRLIQRERDEVNEREALTKKVIEILTPYFQSSVHSVPKIQFFEGHENVESMLYDTYESRQSSILSRDGVMWGFQDSSYGNVFKKYSTHNFQMRKKAVQTARVRLFSNRVDVELQIGQRYAASDREVRAFPKEINFTSTLWVQGDFVIMIQSHQQPYYAIQIHDAWIAANLRTVFQFLWHLTSPGEYRLY